MKRLTLFTVACVLAVLAALGAQLRAQQIDTNDRTFFTFKSAVELPGVTLEPGEYEFRLADNDRRNVVQVLRREDMKPMGQFTFVPTERERTTGETVVMFREAREGTTPAIQYWYFPNEKVGKEFIYPKDQAERIAARTGQTVRTEEGPVTAANADASPAPPAIPPAASDSPRPVSAQADASAATSQPAADADADAARRNAPASAQPSAAAGSTAGNRGVAQTGESASAAADNDDAADAARRNAPAAAQPTAPAGSTAGNRGIGQQSERVDTTARAEAPAQADSRPVGTSGIAQNQSGVGNQQPAGQVDRNDQLPATASPLPLGALIGLLSLAGAAGLRAWRG